MPGPSYIPVVVTMVLALASALQGVLGSREPEQPEQEVVSRDPEPAATLVRIRELTTALRNSPTPEAEARLPPLILRSAIDELRFGGPEFPIRAALIVYDQDVDHLPTAGEDKSWSSRPSVFQVTAQAGNVTFPSLKFNDALAADLRRIIRRRMPEIGTARTDVDDLGDIVHELLPVPPHTGIMSSLRSTIRVPLYGTNGQVPLAVVMVDAWGPHFKDRHLQVVLQYAGPLEDIVSMATDR